MPHTMLQQPLSEHGLPHLHDLGACAHGARLSNHPVHHPPTTAALLVREHVDLVVPGRREGGREGGRGKERRR